MSLTLARRPQCGHRNTFVRSVEAITTFSHPPVLALQQQSYRTKPPVPADLTTSPGIVLKHLNFPDMTSENQASTSVENKFTDDDGRCIKYSYTSILFPTLHTVRILLRFSFLQLKNTNNKCLHFTKFKSVFTKRLYCYRSL